jgi:hypothetical protein
MATEDQRAGVRGMWPQRLHADSRSPQRIGEGRELPCHGSGPEWHRLEAQPQSHI